MSTELLLLLLLLLLSVHSTSSNTSVDIDVFIKPREADEWNLHDVTINRFDLFSFFFFLYRRSIASYERINNNLPPFDKSLSNDYRARIIHFRSTNVELIISGGGREFIYAAGQRRKMNLSWRFYVIILRVTFRSNILR